MRVISGSARGLKLKTPVGLNTRPTLDRIKESLFNIIASDLYEADFLDLFSGSGSIGIEALSRGASSAVFVDDNRKSTDVIKDNLNFTRLGERAQIMNSDFSSALVRLKDMQKDFDIVFMDPPYGSGLAQKAVEEIRRLAVLRHGGFIIAEQSVEEGNPAAEGFEVFRVKKYKITKMTFLGYTEDML